MSNFDAYIENFAYQFSLEPSSVSLFPLGNGHINSTLLLNSNKGAMVLQKLNTHVFPDPKALVNNALAIAQHLKVKKKQGQYALDVIEQIATVEQQHLFEIDGQYWRALTLIDRCQSEEIVKSSTQARIAANAFGQFAAALNDFDANQLTAVIPDFHNLAMRMEMLAEKVSVNRVNRLKTCQSQVDFCLAQKCLLEEVAQISTQLPVRACHNDTKINNMLFDQATGAAKAVIDLDTCMPGYWMYDFGDMIRTFCSPEPEDSTALKQVCIRPEIFAAIVDGYVTPLNQILTTQERESFWLGAKVMCFMIGVRFLTDYLDGDNYFATKYQEHNLDRANNQFTLYRDLVAKEQQLKPLLTALTSK